MLEICKKIHLFLIGAEQFEHMLKRFKIFEVDNWPRPQRGLMHACFQLQTRTCKHETLTKR